MKNPFMIRLIESPKRDTLVPEQQVNDTNPLFDLAYIPLDLQHNH
jgi:hypothetical protein